MVEVIPDLLVKMKSVSSTTFTIAEGTMTTHDEGLRRIHHDPKTAAPTSTYGVLNPVNVPWPTKWHPRPVKITPAPAADAPLPKADVLVVTWTSGEARTMGQLFAETELEDWYEYKNNVAAFIPKVTGPKAPFNANDKGNTRYYQSLGLWCKVHIGNTSIVVVKSGLHPAYDGPDVPMVALWLQMIAQVQPKLLITTGTGGGIGADVELGDVIIASNVRFSSTGQFKNEPWAQSSYACSPLKESEMRHLITDSLLKPNGDRLQKPRIPTMIYPSAPLSNVVTTDTFAFDDSTDFYKLQGLGKCCDMGDAVLGLALSTWTPPAGVKAPQWVAIRNASDPQIPNPNNDLKAAGAEAEKIYTAYQSITTAGSVVATWATIVAQI
jgi:Phosphorylase superfamily